jgi:hypothetical protein
MKCVNKVMHYHFLFLYNFSFSLCDGANCYRVNCPWGEMSWWELSMERAVQRMKCLWGEMFLGRVVFAAKCLLGEMSRGEFRGGELSENQNTVYK